MSLNFIDFVNAHGKTMPMYAPPVIVAHPIYGELGTVRFKDGFVPMRGRWASSEAILRDASKNEIKYIWHKYLKQRIILLGN